MEFEPMLAFTSGFETDPIVRSGNMYCGLHLDSNQVRKVMSLEFFR
jgi:hypothetical protein